MAEFRVGDRVQVKDKADDKWSEGVVVNASPLRVRLSSQESGEGYQFDHVKPLSANLNESNDAEGVTGPPVGVVDVTNRVSWKAMGVDGELIPTRWELFLASESCSCCCPALCCCPGMKDAKCRPPCGCCSCCTFFGIGWLFFLIFFLKVSAEGDKVFQTEEAELQSNLEVKNYRGFRAAADSVIQGCGAKSHEEKAVCEADKLCQWEEPGGRREEGFCKDFEFCAKPPREREENQAFIMVVYEGLGEDGNILDEENLKSIAKYERTMLTTANGAAKPWTDWCWLIYNENVEVPPKCRSPWSPMNMFSVNAQARQTIKTQVEDDKWSYLPQDDNGLAFACDCKVDDVPCSMCDPNTRTLRGYDPNLDSYQRIQAVCASNKGNCLIDKICSYAGIPRRLSNITSRRLTEEAEGCGGGLGGGGEEIFPWFNEICVSDPNCQWSGPAINTLCSSSGYYYPSDSSGLMTESERTKALDRMCDPDNKAYVAFRRGMFDTKFDCTAKKTKYAKTMFMSGGGSSDNDMDKLKDYFKTDWYAVEQELESDIEGENSNIRIMLFAEPLLETQFMNLLYQDMGLSVGALFLVWLYMWFSLESLFLSLCGIFEILFSLPVALSIWSVFFMQKITFLQVLVVYMILGIGADDVFILNDAWQQSKFAGTLITQHWVSRFAFAYRRSFAAMLVTTATTTGSFVIGATCKLPDVRNFCIFAGLVVFVDWVFCITFFASATVVYEKYFANISCCCRGCKSPEGTANGGVCCAEAPPPGKCLGKGCCWGCLRFLLSQNGTTWKLLPKPAVGDEPPKRRALEQFCEGRFHRFLSGIGGKVLLVLWSVLMIVCVILTATQLRTAEKSPPIGRQHIDMTRSIEILLDEFPNFKQPTTFAAFGLDAEDPVTFGDKNDDNEPAFRSEGADEITSPNGQMALLGLCRAGNKGQDSKDTRCESDKCLIQGEARPGGCTMNEQIWKREGIFVPEANLCQQGTYCFMEEFARYTAATKNGCRSITDGQGTQMSESQCKDAAGCEWEEGFCFAVKSNGKLYTGDDYEGLPRSDFLQELGGAGFQAYIDRRQRVLNQNTREFDAVLYSEMTGFSMIRNGGAISGLQFAYIGWNATYAFRNTVEEANDLYDKWEEFFNNNIEYNGHRLKGFQTCELWIFRAVQNEMVSAAITGIVLSLVVAFLVMLVTTMNWLTTLLGILNITAEVLVFLGFMVICGWSLGQYECIFMIGTVGLSVDYTVHLLHAYNHSDEVDRLGRTRTAMGEMGVSVVSSAVTTLFAAFILFFCGFYFFFQFGAFIFLVIFISILMSMTFLMPLMMLVGPQGETGRIRECLKNMKSGQSESADNKA